MRERSLRRLHDQERSELEELRDDLQQKTAAQQAALRLYLQRIEAAKWECGVPPDQDVRLDDRPGGSWEWCRLIGEAVNEKGVREPVMAPLIQDTPPGHLRIVDDKPGTTDPT